MEIMKQTKDFYKYELIKAADILVRDMIKLKKDETILITLDTKSDYRVADAIAGAAYSVGGKPMVVSIATPLASYKDADKYLPLETLTAALNKTDVWIQINMSSLLYSTPYNISYKENPNLRFCAYGMGVHVDSFVSLIGRLNFKAQKIFQGRLTERTRNAKIMRITTPSGGDVTFENNPKWPIMNEDGSADTPGSHMMAGQIGWTPFFESINGTIIFDGSVYPLGLIDVPIKLHIKEGNIVKIEGGRMAFEYEKFLKSFNHPMMLRMAHLCYGLNRGAKLSGNTMEDERVWGCIEWGIGAVGPMYVPEGVEAPAHSDGICLNASVWLDNIQIMKESDFIDSELKELADNLK